MQQRGLSGAVVSGVTLYRQGRVTRSRQVTDGVSYRFGTDTLAGYEYFRQGGLARMRYPSGREVTYTVDDLGRAVTAAGLLGGEVRNYVQSVQYTAFGAVAEMRLKATPPEQTVQLRERYIYNPQRLQMTELDVERCASVACGTPEELLHLEYIYGSNNNGNPREQVIRSAGMNVRQRYDYDGLNRLRQFREEPTAGGPAVLTEDYCYDRHGNRAVLARPGLSAQTPQVTTCTEAPVLGLFPGNRIAGTSYDAGGELGSDGWNGLRFDLEGRLRKSIPGSGAETSYEYDGEGRRVVKQTGLSRTVFVYDAAGQLAAEYGSTVSESRTEFVHGDMLGSTRLVTDGQNPGTTLNPGRRFDYWPFGAELTAGDTAYRTVGFTGAGPEQRFTGKERDGETGLDYFGARYLASAQGRFTSPDPIYANAVRVINPQRWNLYPYAVNNPLAFTDPDGRDAVAVVFRDGAQGLGHAGIISVFKDGRALFSDYGPARPGWAQDKGKARLVRLPSVKFGSDGTPTAQSYQEIGEKLAAATGYSANSIQFAYFTTSDGETESLLAWQLATLDATERGTIPDYWVLGSSCRDYCLTGLFKGGATGDPGYFYFSPIPNKLILHLMRFSQGSYDTETKKRKAKGRADSKVCFGAHSESGCEDKK